MILRISLLFISLFVYSSNISLTAGTSPGHPLGKVPALMELTSH